MNQPRIVERRIRWYQRAFHEALVTGSKRRLIEIAHRRWGKDEIVLQGICEVANNPNCPNFRIGNYWHCLPEYAQGRKALWDAVNANTGKRRIDEAFPPEIVKRRDNTTMFLEFHSGSTYQVIGSDKYDSTVGSGPVGLAYSEWALANPSAWGYHRPMIEENRGWAAFITTPRGNNHAKAMYDMALTNKRWFAELSDINHTGALSAEQLAESLQEYQALYGTDFGRAMFEQEYLCSFSGAMVGAFWGAELNAAEREGRITTVEIDKRYPVHTAWDLGKAVNNPIWCFQVIPNEPGPRIVDFYRPESDDLEEWCKWLDGKGYNGIDFVPHDIVVTEWGTKRTRFETLKLLGRKPRRVAKVSVMEGINAGRQTIKLSRFDATRCELGIDGLKNYRREWDDELKTFRENPVKDWAEHIGSSFRYLGLAWRDAKVETKEPEKPKELIYTAKADGSVIGNMSVREAVEARMRRKRQDG